MRGTVVACPVKGSVCQGCWGFHMLRPVDVPPIPDATAALAWRVHPRGTDEMRVRDALGPLFSDADFTDGPVAGVFPQPDGEDAQEGRAAAAADPNLRGRPSKHNATR